MSNTIAIFQISTEEALRFQLDFVGLNLSGRTLKVNVRDRATNTVRTTLTAPTGLTLVGTGNLTVFYPKGSMSAWPRGEYQADILDETDGEAQPTRIMAVRFVYDEPGKLVYGVRGNQADVSWGGNQAVVTAIGGVGPPGPANSLTIGDVDTLETGQPATVEITGTAPAQVVNFGLPKGNTGTAATIAVGDVLTVAPGEDATVTNVGTSGAAVFDFEIPAGAAATIAVGDVTTGAAGSSASVTNVGSASAAEFDFTIPRGDKGEKGWSPRFALASDGARRVLRVTSWVGGEGAAPATGQYVGATGLVTDIADAVDIRGPAGSVVSPGSIDTGDLVDGILSADATGRAKMADDFVTAAKLEDPELKALAALVGAADKLAYFTGPGAMNLSDLTAWARIWLAAADAEDGRDLLGIASVSHTRPVPAGAAVTSIECPVLEADTLYQGQFLVFPASDGLFGWQSRFSSGGAWDVGGSDYISQAIVGFGGTAAAAATLASFAQFSAVDGDSPAVPGIVDFLLYTGRSGKRAQLLARVGGLLSDASSLTALTINSQRTTAGAITDIRFISTVTSGLAAGSRVRLAKLT